MLLRTNKRFLLSSQDGTELVVKHVMPGDSVHSLLSILDVITVRFISASLIVSVYSLCYYCDVSRHVFTLCRDIQPPIRPYQPVLQLRPPFSVFLLQPFSRCLRNILKHWSGSFRYRLLHTAKYKSDFELKIANVSFGVALILFGIILLVQWLVFPLYISRVRGSNPGFCIFVFSLCSSRSTPKKHASRWIGYPNLH